MSEYYMNSSYYLHRCYAAGYNSAMAGDDYCTYAQCSREWEWWCHGQQDAELDVHNG